MADNESNIVLKLKDLASKGIKEVTGNVGKLGKELKSTGEKGSTSFKKLSEAATALGTKLTLGVTTPLLAAGGALLAFTTGLGKTATELQNAAATTGLTTTQLQEYINVARVAGVESNVFADAATKLTEGIAGAAGGSNNFTKALDTLGISLKDTNGHLKTNDQLLPEIIAKLQAMPAGAQKNALAFALFTDSAKALAPVLGMTSEQMQQAIADAHSMGQVLNEETIKAANEFRKTMDNVQAKVNLAGREILVSFLPIIQKLAEFIQTKVVPAIQQFAGFIVNLIDWFNGLPEPVRNTIGAIVGLTAAIGPALIVLGQLRTAINAIKLALSSTNLIIFAITAAILTLTTLYTTNLFGFRDWANGVIEQLNIVGGMLKTFIEQLPQRFKLALDKVRADFKFLWSTVVGIWDIISASTQKLTAGIGVFFSNMGTEIGLIFEGVVNGVIAAINKIIQGLNSTRLVHIEEIEKYTAASDKAAERAAANAQTMADADAKVADAQQELTDARSEYSDAMDVYHTAMAKLNDEALLSPPLINDAKDAIDETGEAASDGAPKIDAYTSSVTNLGTEAETTTAKLEELFKKTNSLFEAPKGISPAEVEALTPEQRSQKIKEANAEITKSVSLINTFSGQGTQLAANVIANARTRIDEATKILDALQGANTKTAKQQEAADTKHAANEDRIAQKKLDDARTQARADQDNLYANNRIRNQLASEADELKAQREGKAQERLEEAESKRLKAELENEKANQAELAILKTQEEDRLATSQMIHQAQLEAAEARRAREKREAEDEDTRNQMRNDQIRSRRLQEERERDAQHQEQLARRQQEAFDRHAPDRQAAAAAANQQFLSARGQQARTDSYADPSVQYQLQIKGARSVQEALAMLAKAGIEPTAEQLHNLFVRFNGTYEAAAKAEQQYYRNIEAHKAMQAEMARENSSYDVNAKAIQAARQSYSTFDEAIQALQKTMVITPELFKALQRAYGIETTDEATTAMEKYKKSIDEVASVIQGAIGSLGKLMGALGVSSEIINGVTDTLSNAAASIASFATGDIAGGIQSAISFVISLVQLLVDVLTPAWVKVANDMRETMESSVIGGLSSAIKDFVTGKTNLKDFKDAFKSAVYESVLDAIIQALVQKAIIEGLLGDLFQQIGNAAAKGQWDKVTELTSQIPDIVDNALGEMSGAFDALKGIGKNIITKANDVNADTKSLQANSKFITQAISIPFYDGAIRFSNSVDRFGGYVNRLVDDGILVRTSAPRSSPVAPPAY